MPLWTKDTPPNYADDSVAEKNGWVDPETGEILVAIRQLSTKAGAADVLSASFGAAEYADGAPVTVVVVFNERIDITAALGLVVTNDSGADLVLSAAPAVGVSSVTFSGAVAPAAASTLSLAAQTISGTAVDTGTAQASNLGVSVDQAAAAGTRVVV